MYIEQVSVDISKTSTRIVKTNSEDFEILMPTGELKKVELWSGATLLDLGRRLDDRFGENSLIIGLKKDGGTVLPRNYPKIKIYNTKAARERISIVFV